MSDINIDKIDIDQSLKNDTRTIALEIQKKQKKSNSNFFIIFGIVMFFLTIISVSRITILGQFLDDFLFSLPFGWLKYFIYLILIILNVAIFFGVKFYFKKRFLAMIFCVFVVLCWNISSILIIVSWGTKNKDLLITNVYSSESFNYIINSYCNYWKNHSLWDNYTGKWWVTNFNTYSNAYAGGGIIGAFCSGIACYTSIFGNLCFALFFFFLVMCWILTGDAFYLLKRKKYRRGRALRILSLTKQKNNLNKKNKILSFVNIYGVNDGVQAEIYQSRRDYDLTIEMPKHLFREKEKYFDEENNTNMYADGENISNIRQKVDVNSEIYEAPFFKFGDRGYANINSDIDTSPNNPNINFQDYNNYGYINFEDRRNFDKSPTNVSKLNPDRENEDTNIYNLADLELKKNNKQKIDHLFVPRRQNNPDFLQNMKPNKDVDVFDVRRKRAELSRQAELTPFGNKSYPDKHDIAEAMQVTLDTYETKVDVSESTDSTLSVEEFIKTNRGDLDSEYLNIKDIKKKYFKEDKPKKENSEKRYVVATNYILPPPTILKNIVVDNQTIESAKVYAKKQAESINLLFVKSKTDAKITNILIGPSVVKLEVSVGENARVKDILKLENDIKYSLATNNVIIQAPVEGKEAVGIEFPSNVILPVTFREAMEKIPTHKSSAKLTFPIGKGVDNKWIFAQLEQTPHILIAGSTGSGKSVMVNSTICAIIMRAKPHEVKFLMIDPKRVELAYYEEIPHLLAPVISDMSLAASALNSAVDEMERRYVLFNNKNVKHIEQYNSITSDKTKKLPYIVIVIDELADLMMSGAKKEVESSIQRLTQMARACGIHLLIATQRPSVDVITGIIKSNIPSRISFSVSSTVDSRTILDRVGGEALNGKGDMLYDINGIPGFNRAQGCFITDDEIKNIVSHAKNQAEPIYDEDFVSAAKEKSHSGGRHSQQNDYAKDPLFKEVLNYVLKQEATSTSDIQRKFKIGYNKAASFIDIFYDDGIVGEIGSGANQKRKVLVR